MLLPIWRNIGEHTLEQQNFQQTIRDVTKKLGNESILLLNKRNLPTTEILSSGSLVIDGLVGIMGFPKGRIIEIYGTESSGKTTIALTFIAQVQKTGGLCAYIDAEHSVDLEYAARLGVDVENLILSQPSTGEEVFELCDVLSKTGNVSLIVVDSVAALVPEAELNGEVRDNVIGLQARLMSKAMRKLTGVLHKSNTALLFINQIREKVGVIFGSPETTPGGRALKFYSSIRMEVRRGAQIVRGTEVVGHQIKIKVVKNKMAPPYKSGTISIYFSEGIDHTSDLLAAAQKYKVIEQRGGWYIHEGKAIAQGIRNITDRLNEDPELLQTITQLTRERMSAQAMAHEETADEEVENADDDTLVADT